MNRDETPIFHSYLCVS